MLQERGEGRAREREEGGEDGGREWEENEREAEGLGSQTASK